MQVVDCRYSDGHSGFPNALKPVCEEQGKIFLLACPGLHSSLLYGSRTYLHENQSCGLRAKVI